MQFSTTTGAIVGPAIVMFAGLIDTAPLTLQGVSAESSIDLSVTSRARALTRTKSEKKSDEYMKAFRNGDRFRRYTDTANVRVWWGQKKERASGNSNSTSTSSGSPVSDLDKL
jgi:hypothetical protein